MWAWMSISPGTFRVGPPIFPAAGPTRRPKAAAAARNFLTVVPAAGQDVAGLAGEKFFDVLAGDSVQRQPELRGQLRHVPQHVSELFLDLELARLIDHAAAVAHGFLDLLCDLAGLARQAERG